MIMLYQKYKLGVVIRDETGIDIINAITCLCEFIVWKYMGYKIELIKIDTNFRKPCLYLLENYGQRLGSDLEQCCHWGIYI